MSAETTQTEEPGEIGTGQGRWRTFVAHPLVLLPIGVAMVLAGTALFGVPVGQLEIARNTPLKSLSGLLVGLGALLGYYLFQRYVERAPRDPAQRTRLLPELGAGLALGFLIFVVVTAVAWLLGVFTILGVRGIGDLWNWLGIALFSGIMEEALFRGVIQRQLEAMFGTWTALAVTSAFFGLAHLTNPDASLFAAFAIACEAGILLGAAYLVTRRLWLPIGIHMGWNFTQGWVFSIPVSGSPPPIGLLDTRLTGPEWLTGGAFGLEASVIALVVASAIGVAMLVQARRTGQFLPPRWQRRAVVAG